MTRTLGIDIGSRMIRIADIETSGKARRIFSLYELDLDDSLSPGRQLRNFLESQRLVVDRIHLGIGGEPVILRTFEFPFSNSKKVDLAIRGELEDSLPFEIDDWILENKPFGKSGKLFRFLAGLASPDLATRLDALCAEAGILANSYSADTEALAQLALNQCLPGGQQDAPYAICDLGSTSTKIAFLRGCRPEYLQKKNSGTFSPAEILDLRGINKGSHELLEWIVSAQKLSFEEATQWLLHRAEIREGDEISDEIKTLLRPVVVELYQTLQAFRLKHDVLPSVVYFTGATSGIKGLRDFLTQELRVPFDPWPIFEGFATPDFPLTIEKERTFGVAIALAHRTASNPKEGWLNFRRVTAERKVLSALGRTLLQPSLRPILAGLGMVFVGFFIYQFVADSLLSMVQSGLRTDVTAEFRKLSPDLGKKAVRFIDDPVAARRAFDQERKKRRDSQLASGGGARAKSRTEMMLDVTESLPKELILQELSLEEKEDRTVTLEGRAEILNAMSPAQSEALAKTWETALSGRGYVAASVTFPQREGKTLKVKAAMKPQEAIEE